MKQFNADMHFHGLYSGGVSKFMKLDVIAEQARLKGLDVIASSDILHKGWFEHAKKEIIEDGNGLFKHRKHDTFIILQTEVECDDRFHHLVYFPDFACAENLKEKWKGKAVFDSWGCGRPRVRMSAEKIAEEVFDAGGLVGPAHAFTPYFSPYAHFDSVKKAYGQMGKKISFIELGLSADTFFADQIKENHGYTFLSNSDSHSPWPVRIGREFNRIKMKEPSFKEFKQAMERKGESRVEMNIGMDPREGKYHCSACNQCFERHSMKEAEENNWRCLNCGGIVKKGVRARIEELADCEEGQHPEHRAEYLHTIPLAEIIAIALNVKGVNTQKVQCAWRDFVDRFDSEINVLVDVPFQEMREVNQEIAEKVNAFRQGWVLYKPGGGGEYGVPIICSSKEETEKKRNELGQELECKSCNAGQKRLKEF